jgi:hypothetical protein
MSIASHPRTRGLYRCGPLVSTRRVARSFAFVALTGLLVLPLAARAQDAGPDAQVAVADGSVAASTDASATPLSSLASAARSGLTVLEGLAPDELAALTPLARGGLALLVRDPDAGVGARITVLVRARAPMDVVHRVITRVEEYGEIMDGVRGMTVTSRTRNRIGFNFAVGLGVFDVVTTATLHIVSPRRVNGLLLQSTLGPGGLRWDLYPDGDGTLIAYTTWGDPAQGNWFLRTVARVASSSIAAMQVSADTVLALSAARRSEMLAGRPVPRRPTERSAPTGPIAPPAGDWYRLAQRGVVGAVTMDDRGVMLQSSVAVRLASDSTRVLQRLTDVPGYTTAWAGAMSEVQVLGAQDGTVRFRSVAETPIFRTAGEQERVVERDGDRAVVWWRGLSGDYARDVQRFDVRPAPEGATIVLFTGGADTQRAGFLARQIMARDVWMTPGYSLGWKMVWLRLGVRGL